MENSKIRPIFEVGRSTMECADLLVFEDGR